jgi:hypothetical protein
MTTTTINTITVKIPTKDLTPGMTILTSSGTWRTLTEVNDTATIKSDDRHIELVHEVGQDTRRTERRSATSLVSVRYDNNDNVPANAITTIRHLGYFVTGYYGAGEQFDTIAEAITNATQQGRRCIDRREFRQFHDGGGIEYVAERIHMYPEPYDVFDGNNA